jgi:uncharacterized phage protein (TIGR01671 family)
MVYPGDCVGFDPQKVKTELVECDMETVAVGLDGTLYVCDECGSYDYPENLNKQLTLMQCVGLYDNNGRLIYEGDIVRLRHYMEIKTPYLSEVTFDQLGVTVDAHPAHKKMDLGHRRHLIDFCSYGIREDVIADCEVVGNIYENPKLIGGE